MVFERHFRFTILWVKKKKIRNLRTILNGEEQIGQHDWADESSDILLTRKHALKYVTCGVYMCQLKFLEYITDSVFK